MLARTEFDEAAREFSDEPTLVNFERYLGASRRLEMIEQAPAAAANPRTRAVGAGGHDRVAA